MSMASLTSVTADTIKQGGAVDDVERLRAALAVALLGVAELSQATDQDGVADEVLHGVQRVLLAA
jgi:hypothetical protein